MLFCSASKFGAERLCNTLNQLLLRLPPPAVDDSVNAGDACWLNSLAFLIASSKRSIAHALIDTQQCTCALILCRRRRAPFECTHGGAVFNCKRVQPFVPCARCSPRPSGSGLLTARALVPSLAPCFAQRRYFPPDAGCNRAQILFEKKVSPIKFLQDV